MAESDASITFHIRAPDEAPRDVTLSRAILNVGKMSTSDLRLTDSNVSRKHAVIEHLDDGQWRITDLGSTNGTIVRGGKVTQTMLRHGDEVTLGDTVLTVDLGAGASKGGAKPKGKPAKAGGKGKAVSASRPTRAASPEIRGLGEDSFYSDEDITPGASQAGRVLEVALLWGDTVLSIQHFTKPTTVVRVGEAKGCHLTVPKVALGRESLDLVTPMSGGFGLNVATDGVQGDVLHDGSVVPVADLGNISGLLQGGKLPLGESTRARLRFGEFVLLVSYGRMPAKPRLSPLGAVDYTPHAYVTLSAIVHIAFLIILSLLPEEQLRARMDPSARRARMIEILKVTEPTEDEEEETEEQKREEEEKKKAEADAEDKLTVSDTVVEREEEEKDEGLLNKLAKKRLENKANDQLTELTAPERKKKAKEMATKATQEIFDQDDDLLSALLDDSNPMQDQGKQLRQLTALADDGSATMAGAIDPFGGTLDSGGINQGFAATPSEGGPGGPGSNGKREGGLVSGLDKKATKRNLDDIRLKDRPLKPVAIASSAKVSGKLDRKTVQSIIRRNLSGIKWCYQDALQRNKALKGKVTLSFTILPNGKLQSPKAKNPTFSDSALLGCITKKMGRWKFPSPKDGGIVKVSYPLILKSR